MGVGQNQIICLRKKGCGYTAVADKAGISKDTVARSMLKKGIISEDEYMEMDTILSTLLAGKPLI
ncbi:MAG: hypothetical protein HFG92_16555 [Dorea sp.]|jgi:hypothetical protein|nr:hypothetical protein [Dorea sp.]